VDGSWQSPEAAMADAPSGLCFDDTAFHEANDGQSDGEIPARRPLAVPDSAAGLNTRS
jgi:hypothetical protein